MQIEYDYVIGNNTNNIASIAHAHNELSSFGLCDQVSISSFVSSQRMRRK